MIDFENLLLNEYKFLLSEKKMIEEILLKTSKDNIIERIGFEHRLSKVEKKLIEIEEAIKKQ